MEQRFLLRPQGRYSAWWGRRAPLQFQPPGVAATQFRAPWDFVALMRKGLAKKLNGRHEANL